MARRKIKKSSGRKAVAGTKKHHKGTRRRRVGASGKLQPVLMDAVAVGAGIVGARELSILAGGMFPTLMASPTEVGIGETALGVLLAWKAKNGFLRLAGMGAAGNGIMTILNGMGVIGAPKTMTYQFANRRVAGGNPPRLQFVAGAQTTRIGAYPNNFSAVAGIAGGAVGATRKRRFTS
jgi:hypothetical protein